jgi:hypothetical protein
MKKQPFTRINVPFAEIVVFKKGLFYQALSRVSVPTKAEGENEWEPKSSR